MEPRELWAKAPASLITDPDLSPAAKIIYLWLDLRAGQRGFWFGTQATIATALRITPRTVRRALTQLEPRYLTTDRGREKGTLRYSIRTRQSGHQDPLWSDSERTLVSARPDKNVRSEAPIPPLTTDPLTDPVKRARKNSRRSLNGGYTPPDTDWDAVMQRHREKGA